MHPVWMRKQFQHAASWPKKVGCLWAASSGLVLCGSIAWLKQTPAKSVVAEIIPDSGANYLDQIYNDEWLVEKGIKLLGPTTNWTNT